MIPGGWKNDRPIDSQEHDNKKIKGKKGRVFETFARIGEENINFYARSD